MTSRRMLDDDLGFLMARASVVLSKETNRAIAPLGLKVRGYSALAAVCDEPDGITQRRLATVVGLDPSQIVALVDDLEDRKLVQRTTDINDRRNKLIVATEAGAELCDQARRRSAAVTAEYVAGTDAGDVAAARELLRRIAFSGVDGRGGKHRP
ncbi:MarR family transcriptional regulator [Gordonia sp. N1V]|uniref:MarR family winged helix-turn-helix transcriptional regulator n=1 Tax=Gordonia sp. N1V TaxID=3034163 RepID=UPI0023E1BE45|nr:MarR family transcriptional regulator [Gordonia sp. N1V]MDF3281297.1 MarR family transcriptional regulator [Gordonia sp. N1V]